MTIENSVRFKYPHIPSFILVFRQMEKILRKTQLNIDVEIKFFLRFMALVYEIHHVIQFDQKFFSPLRRRYITF